MSEFGQSPALVPRLTRLDERVAEKLRVRGPASADVIAEAVAGSRTTPQRHREVLEILRGLECVGRAVCRDGLWVAVGNDRAPRSGSRGARVAQRTTERA